MDNKTIISKLSENFDLPKWWIEYVIIEYLECRHFFITNNIWKFDYNLLAKEDIESIIKYNVVISSESTLYHDIEQEKLKMRIVSAATGRELKPIKIDNIIVNGLASEKCFVLYANSFDDSDPKLSFNNYCIIYDDKRFYQWKIAELIKGKWKSHIVNLEELEKINNQLINLKYQLLSKKIEKKEARIQARILYRKLDNIRSPIRKELIKFHKTKILKV